MEPTYECDRCGEKYTDKRYIREVAEWTPQGIEWQYVCIAHAHPVEKDPVEWGEAFRP